MSCSGPSFIWKLQSLALVFLGSRDFLWTTYARTDGHMIMFCVRDKVILVDGLSKRVAYFLVCLVCLDRHTGTPHVTRRVLLNSRMTSCMLCTSCLDL